MMSNYTWFEGIPFPAFWISKENLENVCNKFVVKEEDLIILTYPKSGTNWLIEIVCLIQTKGDPKWTQTIPIWVRSPWIESDRGYDTLMKKEGPRLMTSHLPMHLFPKTLFSSKAKVIYLIRNPRDVLVSAYFFWSNTTQAKKSESLGTYAEWFLKGNDPGSVQALNFSHKPEFSVTAKSWEIKVKKSTRIAYGSWFEHIRGWLSMRECDNFLVLYYEDMKKDTMGTIKKISDFLGKKLEPDELNLVLKYSSFQVMKENNMSNYSLKKKEFILNGFNIMRKGTTGDWKNHFTVAQAEAFDKAFQEKMAGFPPGMFPWD